MERIKMRNAECGILKKCSQDNENAGVGLLIITCLISLPVFLTIFLTILLMPHLAFAHRPLTTESAYPVDIHKVKLESGLRYSNFSKGDESYDVNLELNYGVVNNLDIGIEVPYVFWRPEHGERADTTGDVILKSRLLLLKGREGNPISITVQPFFKLPASENKQSILQSGPGLSSGETDFGFLFIATREMEPMIAHLNLGYIFINRPPFGTDYKNIFTFKLAMEYKGDNNLDVVGELTGTTNENPHKDDIFTVLFGVRHPLRKGLLVDVGYSFGVSDSGPDSVVTAGLTKNF